MRRHSRGRGAGCQADLVPTCDRHSCSPRLQLGTGCTRSCGSVLSEPEKWPDRFVHVMAGDPSGSLSVDELIMLVERTGEPRRVTGGFSWTMSQIAEELELHSEVSYRLRDALADLIWRGRIPGQRWHSLKSRFDYVAPALALLCDRQLSAASSRRDIGIAACAIAHRFGHNHASSRDFAGSLRAV